jgi:hypothetical protein
MPTTFTYPVAVSYTPQDNETRITKKVMTFKNCSGWGLNDGCSGWNFNKCPNDDDYCQPYVERDLLYMQYLIPANWAGVAAVEMVDSTTGEIVAHGSSMTSQIGKDADGLRYVNIKIDTGVLPEGVTCFYIKLTFWDCREFLKPTQAFIACVVAAMIGGATLAEATIQCANSICDEENQKIVYSEPYCEVRCNEETMVITGAYLPTKYDCDGFYYGDLLNLVSGAVIPTIYKLEFRDRGFVEHDGATIAENINNGITVSKKTVKKYTLYSGKIPPYVAAQYIRAAGSREFAVDGVVYKGPQEIGKDFDQGMSWIPKMLLTTECDEADFTCSDIAES